MYRKVGRNGYVKIPKEVRDAFKINDGDYVDFFMFLDAGHIILRKKYDKCIVCGDIKNLKKILGLNICTCCAAKMKDKL